MKPLIYSWLAKSKKNIRFKSAIIDFDNFLKYLLQNLASTAAATSDIKIENKKICTIQHGVVYLVASELNSSTDVVGYLHTRKSHWKFWPPLAQGIIS